MSKKKSEPRNQDGEDQASYFRYPEDRPRHVNCRCVIDTGPFMKRIREMKGLRGMIDEALREVAEILVLEIQGVYNMIDYYEEKGISDGN